MKSVIFESMKKIVVLFLILFSANAYSQGKNPDKKALAERMLPYTDSIQKVLKDLYSSRYDAQKRMLNSQLLDLFRRALKEKESFEFGFEELSKDVGLLRAPDNSFRLVNWNVPLADGTHEYYGFIQTRQTVEYKKSLFKKVQLDQERTFELTDVSASVANAERYTGTHKRWYGMLYYDIIKNKTKTKTYYTLLAWDGNDRFSSKKIIDVVVIDSRGTPRFGANIFTYRGRSPKKRIVFEHDANCSMSLKYDAKKDSIVFDHLVPKEIPLEGQYQYYCTDFTYDGFGFKKGKWYFGEMVEAKNKKSKHDNEYRSPSDLRDAIGSNDVDAKGFPKSKKE